VGDLVQEVNGRLGLNQDEKRLADHALRWAEMHLRVQDPAMFDGLAATADLSWEVFGQYVALRAAKMLWDPVPAGPWLRRCPRWLRPLAAAFCRRWLRGERPRTSAPVILQDFAAFTTSVFSRPLDLVGGDSCTAGCDGDTLWVLLADVCGKSWPAYVLSRGLPPLWESCLCARPVDPGGVLAILDGHLLECLPEGLFVEATVARFCADPQGEVSAAAGGKSLVLRRGKGQGAVDWRVLGGHYLGLGLGGSYDQEVWPLLVGDEVLLSSDGLLDQPSGEQKLEAVLKPPVLPIDYSGNLHEAVVRLVEEALGKHSQHDDITVLSVRRR
jgi:hypothetical protein